MFLPLLYSIKSKLIVLFFIRLATSVDSVATSGDKGFQEMINPCQNWETDIPFCLSVCGKMF